MKGSNFTKDELYRESTRLYRNIRRRLDRVRGQEFAPDTAIRRFQEFREKYPIISKSMKEQELKNIYRDLLYIENLKSSSVRGATAFNTMRMDMVKELIKPLSKEAQDKFWEIYGNLYSESHLYENFKYDITSATATLFLQGEDPEELTQRISELYFKYVKANPKATHEEQAEFMARELKNLQNEGTENVSFTDDFDDIFDEYF